MALPARVRDQILPGAMLVLAVLLAVWVIPATIPAPSAEGRGLGPRFFPTLLAICLGLLALAQLATTLVHATVAGGAQAEDDEADETRIDRRTMIAAAGLFAYVAAVPLVGMLPATFLAMVAYMRVLHVRQWWKAGLFSAAFVALLGAFFEGAAAVPLPTGLLGSLLS